MIAIETATDRHAIVTSTFRLRLDWTGDRWVHALDVSRRGAWTCLVQSFECDPEKLRPDHVVSPAYQQVQFQRGEKGVQALLVGQSGPHHFSAVLNLKSDVDSRVVLEVDVADRCRAPLLGLAATYQVNLLATDVSAAGPEGVVWLPAGEDETLSFGPTGPPERRARILLSEVGRARVVVQADTPIVPDASTHRLYYQWGWETSSR
jgi:hypothetical protein